MLQTLTLEIKTPRSSKQHAAILQTHIHMYTMFGVRLETTTMPQVLLVAPPPHLGDVRTEAQPTVALIV